LCFAVLAAAVTPADAQTVAAGPYYATPSWDQKIACESPANCPRFIVLSNWNGEAVLDRETGLVWERYVGENLLPFAEAEAACNNRVVGNRQGWRLPTHPELRTLIDPAAVPPIPPGHPFVNVHTEFFPPFVPTYWTTTPSKTLPPFLQAVTFAVVGASNLVNPTGTTRLWCVRSPVPILP
jgi:hypothetical protein